MIEVVILIKYLCLNFLINISKIRIDKIPYKLKKYIVVFFWKE